MFLSLSLHHHPLSLFLSLFSYIYIYIYSFTDTNFRPIIIWSQTPGLYQPDVVRLPRKLGDSDGPSQWIIRSFRWERTSELAEHCESLCLSDFLVCSTLVWSQNCIFFFIVHSKQKQPTNKQTKSNNNSNNKTTKITNKQKRSSNNRKQTLFCSVVLKCNALFVLYFLWHFVAFDCFHPDCCIVYYTAYSFDGNSVPV